MTPKTRLASEVYRPPGGLVLRWRVWGVGPGTGVPSTLEASGFAITYGGARRAVARAMRRFYPQGRRAELTRRVATLRPTGRDMFRGGIGQERRGEAL
jgi:hypothetical protein